VKSTVVLNQLGFFSERWRVIGGIRVFSDSPDLTAAGSSSAPQRCPHALDNECWESSVTAGEVIPG
jgi:hypothetical protein